MIGLPVRLMSAKKSRMHLQPANPNKSMQGADERGSDRNLGPSPDVRAGSYDFDPPSVAAAEPAAQLLGLLRANAGSFAAGSGFPCARTTLRKCAPPPARRGPARCARTPA